MEIRKVDGGLTFIVTEIVQRTIESVYPKYYPAGAVTYFKRLHAADAVRSDIEAGFVYVLCKDTVPIATVTVKENHILRLFVLPVHQRCGYGTMLLDFAEGLIAEQYNTAVIDASFPAKQIYLKRGYTDTTFCAIQTENGDYLCYDVMKKNL